MTTNNPAIGDIGRRPSGGSGIRLPPISFLSGGQNPQQLASIISPMERQGPEANEHRNSGIFLQRPRINSADSHRVGNVALPEPQALHLYPRRPSQSPDTVVRAEANRRASEQAIASSSVAPVDGGIERAGFPGKIQDPRESHEPQEPQGSQESHQQESQQNQHHHQQQHQNPPHSVHQVHHDHSHHQHPHQPHHLSQNHHHHYPNNHRHHHHHPINQARLSHGQDPVSVQNVGTFRQELNMNGNGPKKGNVSGNVDLSVNGNVNGNVNGYINRNVNANINGNINRAGHTGHTGQTSNAYSTRSDLAQTRANQLKKHKQKLLHSRIYDQLAKHFPQRRHLGTIVYNPTTTWDTLQIEQLHGLLHHDVDRLSCIRDEFRARRAEVTHSNKTAYIPVIPPLSGAYINNFLEVKIPYKYIKEFLENLAQGKAERKRELWGGYGGIYTDDSDLLYVLCHLGLFNGQLDLTECNSEWVASDLTRPASTRRDGDGVELLDLSVTLLLLPSLTQYRGFYRNGLNSRSWLDNDNGSHSGLSFGVYNVKWDTFLSSMGDRALSKRATREYIADKLASAEVSSQKSGWQLDFTVSDKPSAKRA